MHLVELGEHMDDPGDLQPEGGGAGNGADGREGGHLFGGDAFLHIYCLMETFTAGDNWATLLLMQPHSVVAECGSALLEWKRLIRSSGKTGRPSSSCRSTDVNDQINNQHRSVSARLRGTDDGVP